MTPVPLVVVKVGGSLLLWNELPQRLHAWLRRQPAAIHVLIAGAGPLGEFVRHADETFQLGQSRSHWLCIDTLSVSARLLSHVLGDMPVIESLGSLRKLSCSHRNADAACVFDPRPFLHTDEVGAAGHVLPQTWDVTTDSIAARVAECLEADALVLLKSCDPPPRATIDSASLAGIVDRYFSRAAAPLARVLSVNLRGNGEPVTLQRANHGP
jgi:aspartokinase-like uncharacterized kinase